MHSAEGWEELLLPEIERQQQMGKEVAFRGDAAFARPEVYEALEERGVKYAIRIPANETLERGNCRTTAASGGKAEPEAADRVQGVPLPSGQLEDGPASGGQGGASRGRVVSARGLHRDQPDAALPGGGPLLQQTRNRLSCHRFRSNEVRLWLSVIAYNLGNLWRRLVLPKRIDKWSLTSLQQRLVKTGGRLLKHARYYWLLLAESHLTRRLFASMLRRIELLPAPAG